jgi:hypothetical protein
MTRTITYEIPDEVYLTLEQVSRESGRDLKDVAVDWLASSIGKANSRSAKRPELSPEALAAARERMRRNFGVFKCGDPNFADNERIDQDLAEEYGRGLDGDK